MSTKIYNAYKVSEDTSLEQILAYLKRYRTAVMQVLIEDWTGIMKERWYGEVELDGEKKSGFLETLDIFNSHIDKHDGSVFDLTATAVLFVNKGIFYLQFFGVPARVALDPTDFTLSDFHYQNQTDKPDSVSDEEWDMREAVWDEIYDGTAHIPAVAGFSYDLFNSNDTFQMLTKIREGRFAEARLR